MATVKIKIEKRKAFYKTDSFELYHKRDHIFVIWWLDYLEAIEASEYNGEVEYHPYPFWMGDFPNEKIENEIQKFLAKA